MLESTPDAGAFQDRGLPFFILHARLWFLLAVARLALDYPARIAAFAAVLEKIACDDSFPHVGMREAAKRALLACLDGVVDREAVALKTSLAAINRSQFAKIKVRQPVSGISWDRPIDAPRPESHFSFEYDFRKYEVDGLGRLFGMRQWEVGDRLVGWIHKWEHNVTSMYDFAGRRKRGDRNDFYAGTREGYHSFGTYLAWHALAVTAGELLLERPLVENPYEADRWNDLVLKYSITRPDGLWLSDGTDKYPLAACHDLMEASEDRHKPTSDRKVVLSLAGIDSDLSIKGKLIVAGSWTAPDQVHVSIMSALVPDQDVELAARAVASSPEFHMWLPIYPAHDDEGRYGNTEYAPLEAWISEQDAYPRLDGCDPLGSKAALERLRPAKKIRQRFRLTSKDRWEAIWTRRRDLPAFASCAWGVRTGEGRSESWERGLAFYVDSEFIKLLLRKLDRSLLLLVKLRYYREKQRYSDDSGSGGDSIHSWAIAAVNKSLEINAFSLSEQDCKLVQGLPEHSRYDFRERWRILSGGPLH